MTDQAEREIRPLTRADAETLRARGDARALHGLSNPSGPRTVVSIAGDGAFEAVHVGTGQRMLLDGEQASFGHVGSAWTDVDDADLLVELDRASCAAFGGQPPEADAVLWGMPDAAGWRLCRTRMKRFDMVRTQLALARPAGTVPEAGLAVEEVERFPADVDELFAAAADSRGAIAVRDRTQLDWRFGSAGGGPDRDYRIGLARGAGGELLGYAVFRHGDLDDLADQGLICDWLTAPGREDAGAGLRAWLDRCAADSGAERLLTLFPDTAPEWTGFQRAGFRAERTGRVLLARTFVKRITMRRLYAGWHYTLGDTDLC